MRRRVRIPFDKLLAFRLSMWTMRGNPGPRFGVSVKGIDGAANVPPVEEYGYAAAHRRPLRPNS
jgi:hypothetical protein